MRDIDLHLDPNEASDLCPVLGEEALAARGWDRAFVTVLDETRVEKAIALVVHDATAGEEDGWSCRPIRLSPTSKGKTEDAEACAVHDGWVYVLGSQFGKKDGPLQPRRAFAARVREDDLLEAADGKKVPLEVARLRFALHRAVNDALAAAAPGLDLLPLGARTREAYIDATIRRGAEKKKAWSGRVLSSDHPINVEGCAFRPSGRLLLGLRHPVTADGHPILVEVEDPAALFDDADAGPRCSHVWFLENVGSAETPMGVRALHSHGGDRFDAVVGNLDSAGKGATILEDHPAGREATSQHVRFELPVFAAAGAVEAEVVRDFDDFRRIEGLVVDDAGRSHYVIDHDGRVDLRVAAV